MTTDTHQTERGPRETVHNVNRQRRVWTVVAIATATLFVLAGAVTFTRNQPADKVGSVSPTPTPPPTAPRSYALDAYMMVPPLTAQLPNWVASAGAMAAGPGGYTFGQTIGDAPSGLCPDSLDRTIQMFSVNHTYPLDGSKNVSPTYAQYVQAWKDIQRLGFGTVSDISTTTVGRRPATTMTVEVTREIDGLAGCGLATDAKHESGCFGLVPGLTLNLAIVGQSTGQPPTLLWETHVTSNRQESQAVASEFASWLSTVKFQ